MSGRQPDRIRVDENLRRSPLAAEPQPLQESTVSVAGRRISTDPSTGPPVIRWQLYRDCTHVYFIKKNSFEVIVGARQPDTVRLPAGLDSDDPGGGSHGRLGLLYRTAHPRC